MTQPNEIRYADVQIKVAGQDISTTVMADVVSVEVDLSVEMPSMFTIDLHDAELEHIDSALFDLGKEVEILFPDTGRTFVSVMKGKIATLEPIFDAGLVTRFRVRGYDGTYLMHQERKARTFQNVTDSDLASQIAGEYGLSGGTISSTSTTYEHVFQDNQTDFEFLRERAHRAGRWFYVSGGRLHFKTPGTSGSATLDYGSTLRSFFPRLSTTWQHSEVTVKGWDRAQKQAIVGTRTSPNHVGGINVGGNGGAVMASKFSSKKLLVHELPVISQAEADAAAQSLLDFADAGFVQGEGEARGNPGIVAGIQLTLQKLGNKFSGTYFVSRATHRFAPGEEYLTSFTVAGFTPDTTWDLLSGGAGVPGRQGSTARWPGVVVGIVTNTDDPDNQGRVKVKYPWLDDAQESWWARLAAPLAGPNKGFFLVPEVNDEVLVAFEQGDFNRPYVIGSLWNGTDAAPAIGTGAASGEKPLRLTLVSATGHSISIYDDAENKVEVLTAGGHTLLLDDANKLVKALTAGGHELLLDDQGKKVNVKSSGGAELAMDDNARSVKLTSPGTAEVSATGGLTLKGSTVNLEGSGPVTIKGAVVNIN